jgi:hypothetical protein
MKRDHEQEEDDVLHREGAIGEDPDPDQGVRDPELVDDEGGEQGEPDDDACPGRGVAPAPDRGLLQP